MARTQWDHVGNNVDEIPKTHRRAERGWVARYALSNRDLGPDFITFVTLFSSYGVYASRTAAESALSAACSGRLSPCGTTKDQDGIKRVEYKLQRVRTIGTYCWDPNYGTTGYTLNHCAWRDASTSPTLPTANDTSVKWWVPVTTNEPTTVFQSGNYTLFIWVTDNAGITATTESTITFRRN